jgi:hypothetical protein
MTIVLQIIQLVMCCFLTFGFIVFMVRPYLGEVWAETRRVAELLASLPSEISVNAIVARTLAASQQGIPGGALSGNPMGK